MGRCISSCSTCCISTAGTCGGCALLDRKRVLSGFSDWHGMLRYSDHQVGNAAGMLREACRHGPGRHHLQAGRRAVSRRARPRLAEGEMPRPRGARRARLDAARRQPHRPRRAASRLLRSAGRAALRRRRRHRVLRRRTGGCASGSTELASDPPKAAGHGGDPLPKTIHWVRPELVAEIQFAAWSGSGRVRQAVYLGLREDKAAAEVVRDPADPEAERKTIRPPPGDPQAARRGPVVAVPPRRASAIVTARAPRAAGVTVGNVALTHPDRELWPGITKQRPGGILAGGRRAVRCPGWRAGRSRSCAARRASTASTSSRSTATARCRPRSARARRTVSRISRSTMRTG